LGHVTKISFPYHANWNRPWGKVHGARTRKKQTYVNTPITFLRLTKGKKLKAASLMKYEGRYTTRNCRETYVRIAFRIIPFVVRVGTRSAPHPFLKIKTPSGNNQWSLEGPSRETRGTLEAQGLRVCLLSLHGYMIIFFGQKNKTIYHLPL